MQRVRKATEMRYQRTLFQCPRCKRTVFVASCLTPHQHDRILVECTCKLENGHGQEMEIIAHEQEASSPT